MKKLLLSYAEYNLWANEQLTVVLNNIDKPLHFETVISSFPNLFATLEHIWQAEYVWKLRILNQGPSVKPSFPTKETKALVETLLQVNKEWIEFVHTISDEKLEEIVNYNNWQGTPFSTPVWQIIHHVFNHSTFHRGQLITMLRQLGVTTLPSTDYITYTRIV